MSLQISRMGFPPIPNNPRYVICERSFSQGDLDHQSQTVVPPLHRNTFHKWYKSDKSIKDKIVFKTVTESLLQGFTCYFMSNIERILIIPHCNLQVRRF